MESNPDEFRGEYGRWSDIRNSVFAYKEQGERSPWIRGLTNAEIDAMYEKLSAIHRAVLDEYVMKNVLDTPEEEKEPLRYKATERYAHGMTDPSIYQNAIQPIAVPPGSWQNVANQTSNTSLVARLKQELGIK
jgi:hypothetical protein